MQISSEVSDSASCKCPIFLKLRFSISRVYFRALTLLYNRLKINLPRLVQELEIEEDFSEQVIYCGKSLLLAIAKDSIL